MTTDKHDQFSFPLGAASSAASLRFLPAKTLFYDMFRESTHGHVITLAGSVPDLDDHPYLSVENCTSKATCLATNKNNLNDYHEGEPGHGLA